MNHRRLSHFGPRLTTPSRDRQGDGLRGSVSWTDSVPTNTRAPSRIPESSTSVFIETRRGGSGGGVGYGAYPGGGAAGPGASKSFLLPSGWRLRPDKGS